MSRYKKKKHNRILNAPKKRIKPPVKGKSFEDIVMTKAPSKKQKSEPKPTMHVVAGRKGEKIRKFKAMGVFTATIIVIILLLQIILPAGIVQTVSNGIAVIGTGSYPIGVSGSETLSVVPFNNYYFNLTDTHISAYSTGGKVLFSEAHGFEKAVLSTSAGRILVYNQGGNEAIIYDLKGERYRLKTKHEIICGAISNSGSFAVVTYSDRYASAVTVYNRYNKMVYEWYSAEDMINNIAISSSGKKIAVSTFNSSSGIFNSKVNIINFKSATPEHSVNFENQIVYGLKSSNKSYFSIIKSNGVDFVKWYNHKTLNYNDDYDISYYRSNSNVNVSVFSRERDKTDNKIVIFSKSGKVKTTVKYNGVINDIQVRGSNIYCISDTTLSALDFEGKIKFTHDFGFGGRGICVCSANVVAVITDNEIKRVKL